MTTTVCTVPIRVSKNNREIDPAEDERQGIVQNITKQAYWHVSSCKPGKRRDLSEEMTSYFRTWRR